MTPEDHGQGSAAVELPRRTAHAVHALMTASEEAKMPVTAAEVVIYDEEAGSARSTGAALRSARRLGLAVYTGRYWMPTFGALNRRAEFEERYLADTEASHDR